MTVAHIVVVWMVIAVWLDAYRDKRADRHLYPSWHTYYKYPWWVPGMLRRKFSNRWHIVKQISFLSPHIFVLSTLIVSDNYWLAASYIVGGAAAWAVVSKPLHWS